MGEHVCPPSHRHGETSTCYQSHRCRCGECRAWNRAAHRAWYVANRQVIPDPYAVDMAAQGFRVSLTSAQRAEVVRRLWSLRWSDGAIAAHLGVTGRTVLRIRQRHGWRAWEIWEMQKMMKEAA